MTTTTEVIPEEILLTLIDDNPFQTRMVYHDDKIGALAASIAEHGLLQIPLARRVDDRVQLAFGHSRFRAYQTIASVSKYQTRMPLIIRELDDQTMALHAWTENKDRTDLTAYEEAKAIQKYMQAFSWNQKQVSQHLKLDPSTVSNKLRLLKLPPFVLDQVQAGEVSERQAQALLPLTDLPEIALQQESWVIDRNGKLRDIYTLASKVDSGQLREQVARAIEQSTISLNKATWHNIPLHNIGAHAALCSECPIRIKSSNRCPDRACADRKERGYQVQLATQAAESLGLRPAPKPDWSDYNNLGGCNLTKIMDQALMAKCNNLVVVQNPYQMGLSVPRHPSCWVVCAHGRGKRCKCTAALAKSGDPKASEEAKKKLNKARMQEELIRPTQATLTRAVAKPNADLICVLIREINASKAAKKIKNVQNLEQAYALLAEALIERHIGYSWDMGHYDDGKRSLTTLLNRAGLTAPWEGAQDVKQDVKSEPNQPDLRANTPAHDPAANPFGTLNRDLQAALTALGLGVRWAQGRLQPIFLSGDDATGTGETFYDSAELRRSLPTLELIAGVASAEDRAGILPGITIIEGSMADRHEVAHLVAAIAMLEVATEVLPMQVVELVSTLEGMPDALDDATYEALMFRLHRLQSRQRTEVD